MRWKSMGSRAKSTSYLLAGYLALAAMFYVFWVMESEHRDDQLEMIDTSDMAVQKMRLIVDLIEIARQRVRLSHEMLSAEDVFNKDEISQRISRLAVEFNQRHGELTALPLTGQEQKKLEDQRQYYPEVIRRLELISVLALRDSETDSLEARRIVIQEIVPLQEKVIDSFLSIASGIQDDISRSSRAALSNYQENKQNRGTLVLVIFLGSLLILLLVIWRMQAIERRLEQISLTDGLTQIPNRRGFDKALEHEWRRCVRSRKAISLLMIDVDYFKKYNDFYGHQEGDHCLVAVADVLKRFARRSSDIAARYGGEEFAVILSDTDQAGVMERAQKLVDAVRAQRIPHEMSEIADVVTISVGVACLVPEQGQPPEQLVTLADRGLYAAKAAGRNRCSLSV